MRYRLSGELPERAQAIMQKRFNDQIEQAKKIAKNKNEKNEEATEITLETWRQTINQEIQTLRRDLFTGEIEENPQKLATSIERWSHLEKTLWRHYEYLTEDPWFLEQTEPGFKEILEGLCKKIEHQQDGKTEADQIELLALIAQIFGILNRSDASDLTRHTLQAGLKKNHFQTLAHLLDKKTGVEKVACYALTEQTRENWTDTPKHATTIIYISTIILPHLIEYMKREVQKSGLEATRQENEYLAWLGRAARMTPGAIEALKSNDCSFEQAANDYIEALAQNLDNIKGGYPSHGTAQTILAAIVELYIAGTAKGEVITPPATLLPLLQKIHQEKVLNYSTPNNLNYLHGWVLRTAEIAGIPLSLFNPKYPRQ